MNILAYFATPIHFDCFSLELGNLQFDGAAWVGGRDLKLQFKFIPDKIVHAGTRTIPGDAFLIRLNFKPIIIIFFIQFDVGDQRL